MRVALEASYAFMGRGGIDRYAYELFQALLSRGGPEQYQLFTMFAPFRFADLSRAPFTSSLARKVAMAQVELTRRLWSHLGAPTVERLAGPADLVHIVHHFAPPVGRNRLIVTVHDLSFEYPVHEIAHAAMYSRDTRRAVERADCIIAVSEFTRRELERLYDVPRDRVRVVYEGVRTGQWEAAASDSGAGPPYFLTVGKLEPRKNLVELAEAFSLARRRFRLPHRLVIVGKPGRNGAAVVEALRRVEAREHVECRGFVSHDELAQLYRRATAFVYPSVYEGFGLPVLEAMAAGTPVLASSVASLPEVVGSAGMLLEPGCPEAWAEALGRLATDESLCRDLVRRGRDRARGFTWERAAEETAAVYRQAVG